MNKLVFALPLSSVTKFIIRKQILRSFALLQIPLDYRTGTTGMILCQHVKTLDIQTRSFQIVEQLPEDLLERAIVIVQSQVDKMI